MLYPFQPASGPYDPLIQRFSLPSSMGSQTMFLSSAGGGSGLVTYSPIVRQPSIYTSTLEELQNAMNESGKKFGSMNMDEFLKNIWVAEDVATVVSDPRAGGTARQPSLQRQKSLILPSALSGKTVDEVWKNIQRQPLDGDSTNKLQQQLPPRLQQRQETMGEVTLEDFLLRAGIAREDDDGAAPALAPSTTAPAALLSNNNGAALDLYSPIPTNGALTATAIDNLAAPGLQADWMNFANRQQHQQLVQQAEAAAALAVAKRGVSPSPLMLPGGNPMYDGIPDGAGYGLGSHVSSLALPTPGLALSPAVSDFSMHGKKRTATEAVIEKTVERRQRRMIKNRESAARSRARKQAYTVELEAVVTLLKEENVRLQQQQALRSQLPETGHSQHSQLRVLRRNRSW